jgi:hypothetical protein
MPALTNVVSIHQMPGRPDPPALALALLALALLLGSAATSSAATLAASKPRLHGVLAAEAPRRGLDAALGAAALGTQLMLLSVMLLGEPSDVVSLGIHQVQPSCRARAWPPSR